MLALWFTPKFDENQFHALIAAQGIRHGPHLSNDLRLLLLRRLLLFCARDLSLFCYHRSKKQKTGNRPFPKPGTPFVMA
jgi:hypothetical protein